MLWFEGKRLITHVSLRLKLTAALTFFLVATIVGLSLFNISSQRQSLISSLRRRSTSLAKTFATNSAQALLFRDYALLDYFLDAISKENDVRYAHILDADGKVLVSTQRRFEGHTLGNRIDAKAAAADEPLIQEFNERGEGFYDVAVPVDIGGKKWGTVRIGISLESTSDAISNATQTIINRALITCAVGLLLAFLLAQSLARPISLLAEASKQIEAGDLTQKVRVNTRDEIGELARTFNQMTESLRSSITNFQRRLKERSLLYDLSSTISTSMSIKEISAKLLSTCIETIEADAGSFMVLDEDRGKLRVEITRGLSSVFPEMEVLDIGVGIAGKVAKDAKPQLVENIEKESPRESCRGNLKSSLSVPLIIGGKVFGVLNINASTAGKFTDEDLEIVSHMVEQAVVAIEREQLVQSLGEEKSKTESILESMADGVLAVNEEGKLFLMNAKAEEIFALRMKARLGRALIDVIKQREVSDLIIGSLKEGKGSIQEIDISEAEERIVQVQTTLIYSADGFLGVVAIVRDITELRRLSQAKSDFISMVSHELRTPLASIKAYTDTLAKKGDSLDKTTLSEFFEVIQSETRRLDKMISQLLDASTIEAGHFEIELEAVNLALLIESAVNEMRKLAADDFEIRVRFPKQVDMIVGDPDKIRQVVTNLVDNAIKYTKEKGKITVSLQETGDDVRISVADNATGIDKEQIHRIFQRFYRVNTDTSHEEWGAGLGLFIAKSIVEAHGGRIWAESRKNKGSTFVFTLPKHRRLAGTGQEEAAV